MSPRIQALKNLAASVTKFGIVGLIGFGVDFFVYNFLLNTVLSASVILTGPLIAKFISTTLAILANWIGNRNWTFSKNRSESTRREAIEFFIVSIATLPISLLCLWVSHYLLGYTSVLADNISGMIIGTILGSVARYVLYRYWVFSPSRTARIITTNSGETSIADASESIAVNTGTIQLAKAGH